MPVKKRDEHSGRSDVVSSWWLGPAPFIRVFAPLDRPWPPFVDSRLRLTSLWV